MNDLIKESTHKLLKTANRLIKSPADQSFAKKSGNAEELKIAVLGTCSIQHFVKLLKLFLDRENVDADIYEGEYDGINMDTLDKSSPFYTFDPKFVILLFRHNDFRWENEDSLKEAIDYTENIISHISEINGVTILLSNIALPPERPWGSLEANYGNSSRALMRKYNMHFAEHHPGNVRLIDMEYLSSMKGKESWFDDTAYYLTKQGFNMDYLKDVAWEVTSMIMPGLGRVRKCLVLDLDNTVWGGVVGDEGPEGINLDPNDPIGEAFLAFQKYVLSLKRRGVLIAVNSKNDEDIAKEPFEKNPNMLLKLNDIACFVANWSDKAGNMAYIAKQLNIGMNSLVFFDDNPAEREMIRRFCPEVMVIDVPDEPENFVNTLDRARAFEWTVITKEDLSRSDSYQENRKREELAASFVDYKEYLKALEMKGHAGITGEAEAERFAQLTNKSNQFNLRTMRYSDGEIRQMMDDKDTRLIYVSLSDKFTEYGIISCIVLKKGCPELKIGEDACFIENWCMSCRVLKRGVENLAFKKVCEEAREMGCKKVVGEYVRTKKNGMVEGLYASLGFAPVSHPGHVMYEFDLSKEPAGEYYVSE
ncbi:MAG: HAD-IIIC family phosphatase [Lachnospiraceae bacterium]|nr:HAD-IIIC family phosphatase [Lachnospiraceae bacterium]